jgi:hypothetical protein
MPQANPVGPTVTDVTEEYDPAFLRRIIEYLRDRAELTYVRNQDVDIVGQPDDAGRRPSLILRSPDGNSWRVLVDNAGALSTELVPFPAETRFGVMADI